MAFSLAISSRFATPSFALQSARREAQQAEQTANDLRTQAQSAQRSAAREQARADSLTRQSSEADNRSVQARRGLSSTDATSSQQTARNVPFVNASGHSTGILLNATA